MSPLLPWFSHLMKKTMRTRKQSSYYPQVQPLSCWFCTCSQPFLCFLNLLFSFLLQTFVLGVVVVHTAWVVGHNSSDQVETWSPAVKAQFLTTQTSREFPNICACKTLLRISSFISSPDYHRCYFLS